MADLHEGASMTFETYWYLEALCDELVPCAPTLEAWATWLAEPDGTFGRDTPARPGEEFTTFAMDIYDVTARLEGGQLKLSSPPPAGCNFFAVRYGENAGWDTDSICLDLEELREYCVEDREQDETIYIAFGVTHDRHYLATFHSGDKPLTVEPITQQ